MEVTRKELNKTPFSSILQKYDNFFFDCDGVLFNGNEYLNHTFEALNKLREQGKNIFFITNTSKSSRKKIFDKISKGGFVPEMDKIFTSSYLAARYLSLNRPEIKKVYALGGDGLTEELSSEGLEVVHCSVDNNKTMDGKIFDDMQVDKDIGAVVVGVDYDFNFYKLCYASALLQEGAFFLATNVDSNVQMKHHKLPGGGTLVKALEYASGVTSHLVGKPCPDVVEIARETFGLDPKKCLMIGDRLESDVMLGKNANVDTFVVLTGCSSEEDLIKETQKVDGIIPDYYWDKVEI